jgi:benzodiazapine receptor
MITYLEMMLLVAPFVSGYSASAICGMDETAGKDVSFRPPGWVFAVVWPILYVLLGISWVVAHRLDPMNSFAYGVLTLLLVLWLFTYSCAGNKDFAMYVLLESIIAVLACMYVGNTTSRLLILPVVLWLVFATVLNAAETAPDDNLV